MNWTYIQQLLDEPGGFVIYHATAKVANYYPLRGELEKGTYSLLSLMTTEEFVQSTKQSDNKYIGIENYTGSLNKCASYGHISWFSL